MSFDHQGRRRETYHHGNLREALVEAVLGLIAERGPAGFSFAELARAAGVSPAAPYRHFRDRKALIAEVARRGFAQLAESLDKGWNAGRPDPLTAIHACGRAYLDFARREPASYAAMFQTELPLTTDPGLRAESDRAFGVLRTAADVLAAEHPADGRPPALMIALHIWAFSHGIASLFVGEGRRPLPMSPEDLLEAGVLIYLQSLGLAR